MKFFLPPPKGFEEQKRLVDNGPTVRRIVDTGPAMKKISPELVMKSLGAEPMTTNRVKSRSLRAKTIIFALWCLFWTVIAAVCGLALYVACLDTEAMCISAVCTAAVCMFGVWYAYCDFQETPEKS